MQSPIVILKVSFYEGFTPIDAIHLSKSFWADAPQEKMHSKVSIWAELAERVIFTNALKNGAIAPFWWSPSSIAPCGSGVT